MVSDNGCRMTPERAEAILRAWETGLYVEWLDTDKAGYSLTPKRLIVGHCDERNRIIGRGYNVRSVTMGGDGLVITTDRLIFTFPLSTKPSDRREGVVG